MNVDKDACIPNSMAVPSRASFVINAKSKKEVAEAVAFAQKESLPLIPLGNGTNILPKDYLEVVVVILDLKGLETKETVLKISAGEEWDEVVSFAVEKDLSGLEALSAIPGKMGAAPIQNIGAYGSEIAHTLISVESYDRKKKEFVILSKKDCQLGYRDSLFKRNKERFIISSVTLKLSKEKPKIPQYKDVLNHFEEEGNKSPTLLEIRETLIKIRRDKLPDFSTLPNSGSFFKNPILEPSEAERVKKILPNLPTFPFQDKVKISAGFLIDKAGLKGRKVGKAEIYKNNALVLTNPNSATFSEIISAKDEIIDIVFKKFGVQLEPEVNILK